MKQVLLKKLIEKDYFAPGSEIDASYKGIDISGSIMHAFQQTFTVVSLSESRKSGNLIIKAASNEDGYMVILGVDSIINIDGMTPERFAENFMLDEDGKDIKPSGKRRGRRPKGWVEETEDILDGEDFADAA